MIRLVKFSCGCIGLYPEDGKTRILQSCNGGELYAPDYVHIGNEVAHSGKAYVELSPEEVGTILFLLHKLVDDGYAYRRLKPILKELVK